MSTTTKERRIHRRVPTSLEIEGQPDNGGVLARMIADNFSLGGLQCVSTADFPEMTRLAVRLMLPNGRAGDQPVDVEAVVVRREKLTGEGGNGVRFRLALFFTRVEEAARRHLARYLDAPRS